MTRILEKAASLYPLWIVLTAAAGLLWPPSFLWVTGGVTEAAIAHVMLGMGFTLRPDDFKAILRTPGACALGFACQYTAMPLLGWAIGKALALEPGFAAGLILVSACPGGVASNVIAFLAKADAALSVALTAASTLAAFIFTPLWCQVLAGASVEVDGLGMCLSTLRTVLAPVAVGVFCNWRFPKAVAKVAPFGPVVSVLAIVILTGGIMAPNAAGVMAHAGRLAAALCALHGAGFAIGYGVARLLGFGGRTARTVSIEVGMQNGGLAAMLARRHFAADPTVGVPSVFCSLVQTVMGSVVAALWSRGGTRKENGD